jgi:alkylation response protein AidB-like acyl-CoA dehydrogenase
MAFDPAKLAADTESFCREIRPEEELCYAERRKNDHVIRLALKHNLLGMNIAPEYGGRGADNVSYFQALRRGAVRPPGRNTSPPPFAAKKCWRSG